MNSLNILAAAAVATSQPNPVPLEQVNFDLRNTPAKVHTVLEAPQEKEQPKESPHRYPTDLATPRNQQNQTPLSFTEKTEFGTTKWGLNASGQVGRRDDYTAPNRIY